MATIGSIYINIRADSSRFLTDLDKVKDGMRDVRSETARWSEHISKQNQLQTEATNIISGLRTEEQRLFDSVDKLDEMYARHMLTQEQHVAAINQITTEYDRSQTVIGQFSGIMESTFGKMLKAGFLFGIVKKSADALIGSLEKSQAAGATFGETMQGIIDDLRDTLQSIPIIGHFVRAIDWLRNELVGWGQELRDLSERQAAADAKLAEGAAALARRADEIAELRRQEEALAETNETLAMSFEFLARAETFNSIIDSLNEVYIGLTQGAEAAERYRLGVLGISEAGIETIMTMRRMNDELEAQKKAAEEVAKAEKERMDNLRRQADTIINSILTPQEKYRKQLELLKELLEESFLTQEQFQRAVAAARDELRSALGGLRELMNPAAVEQRFTAAFPGQSRMIDPLEELDKTEKAALEEAKKHTVYWNSLIALQRDGANNLAVVNF